MQNTALNARNTLIVTFLIGTTAHMICNNFQTKCCVKLCCAIIEHHQLKLKTAFSSDKNFGKIFNDLQPNEQLELIGIPGARNWLDRAQQQDVLTRCCPLPSHHTVLTGWIQAYCGQKLIL